MNSFTLVRTDLANLRRDPMLVAATLAPVLIGLLIGFGFEPLVSAVSEFVELAPHRPVVVGAGLALVPLLAGFVVGFITAEEREEKILDAVAITPVGRGGFLRYRFGLPGVLGAVSSGALAVVIGDLSVGQVAAVALLAGGTAVMVTMAIAVVAKDRVQALAISKLTGFVVVVAVGYQFVDGSWRILLGLIPTTWLVEVAVAESWLVPLLLGVVTHTLAIAVLSRRVLRIGQP